MKNIIMIIIAILAIASVCAFMTKLANDVDFIDVDTSEPVCEHELVDCVCSKCGFEDHIWDTSDLDCQMQGICFECEAENGPYGSHVDYNYDGKCDLCNVNFN